MLRDKFAMAAMQGMQSDATKYDWTPEGVAQAAYVQADAMMRERQKWANQIAQEYCNHPTQLDDDVLGPALEQTKPFTGSKSKRPVPPEVSPPPISYE